MASIQKRKNSYCVHVSNGRDINGRQITETATFKPDPNKTDYQNKKALKKFAIDFEEKVKSGKYLNGEKISFQEFSEQWLHDYVIRHMEDKTYALYEDYLHRHINPEIGHLKLSKVQPVHLNSLYNKLALERKDGRAGGYSAKTIKDIHDIISSLYHTAVEWNIVADNPCSRVRPPKPERQNSDIKYFTLSEAQRFLNFLDKGYQVEIKAHDRVDDTGKKYHVDSYSESKKIPTQFKLFFHIALFCGMRRGEIVALEWSDIDFEKSEISITKSTVSVKGRSVTKKPKTKASIRKVSVPAHIVSTAKIYRKEQLQYRMSIGSQWIGDNYIFIQWDGKQMHPDTPYKTFKKIIAKYNETVGEKEKLPDIALHGLRHTNATLLISQNVDVNTVAGALGHSRASTTTDIYGHSLKKAKEEAAKKMESLFYQEQNPDGESTK